MTELAYDVVAHDEAGTWRVAIVDPRGAVVAERTCRDAADARIYASTVRQHLYWLSPERFREYYRLTDTGDETPPTVGG
ncbi:MAG: hypothetical protein WEA10_03010 [Actinomycetota bacterium]